MKTTHSRAKVGGEFGANGEWYDGGRFINTVANNPKGSARKFTVSRKQEVEPFKWEVSTEGKMSIYKQLAGVEIFNRATMQFTFNESLSSYFATPEAIANRKSKIAAFNRGERWV